MPRRTAALLTFALLVVACGGETTSTTTSTTAPSASSSTSIATVTPEAPTTQAPSSPAVLSLSTGRGDDDSLEVGVWFAADPFGPADHRIVVGVDVDESFPGTGDPYPHLDGRLELTPDGALLFDGDRPIDEADGLGELVSWGYAEGVLRVFFIGTVPPKAGTVWVIVQSGGAPVVGGVAGTPFGTACSFHDAGLDLPPDPGGVPDAGTPCRYPLG